MEKETTTAELDKRLTFLEKLHFYGFVALLGLVVIIAIKQTKKNGLN